VIFDLAGDFAAALAAMPSGHPKRRLLGLLEEAVRRDIHFIARQPTALFQCMWNTCWWYDCPEAAAHYIEPEGGWTTENAPWKRGGGNKLYTLLERWRKDREKSTGLPLWLRSHRPPVLHLGAGLKAVLSGHEGLVTSVSYSPDGRRIVSGCDRGTVRIWSAENGVELAAMPDRFGYVTSVAYSPDGRWIVSGHWDHNVRVWDAESAAEVAVLEGHEDDVTSVSYSPDGLRIVSGAKDRTVRVWDAVSGAELTVLSGHRSYVTSVSYSPDGRRIVSGSQDETVRVWDAVSGAELTVLSGHRSYVTSVSYSPDGRRIVSGAGDGTVRVWDAGAWTEILLMYERFDNVQSVSFSPDGRRIIGAGLEVVHVWDADTGAKVASLRGDKGFLGRVACSPDGGRIACCAGDTVLVLDASSAGDVPALHDHDFLVQNLAYSADGQRLASICYGNCVRVWDTESGVELAVLSREELDSLRLREIGHLNVTVGDVTVRVTDCGSHLALDVTRGSGGAIPTTARASSTPTWRARAEEAQTNIEPTAGGEPVARFPVSLALLIPHPSGRIWAGAFGHHVYLFELEEGGRRRLGSKAKQTMARWLRDSAERVRCFFRRK